VQYCVQRPCTPTECVKYRDLCNALWPRRHCTGAAHQRNARMHGCDHRAIVQRQRTGCVQHATYLCYIRCVYTRGCVVGCISCRIVSTRIYHSDYLDSATLSAELYTELYSTGISHHLGCILCRRWSQVRRRGGVCQRSGMDCGAGRPPLRPYHAGAPVHPMNSRADFKLFCTPSDSPRRRGGPFCTSLTRTRTITTAGASYTPYTARPTRTPPLTQVGHLERGGLANMLYCTVS
jgi:hypothetical protein